jgi:hypoxanthine phosphoribosyltransferase
MTTPRDDRYDDLARVLLTANQIESKVDELAGQISHDYAGLGEIYLVGILKGAFIFLADLARRLTVPHMVDFMAVSSYGSRGAVSGAVRLILDVRQPIEGRHVIIVEDIVDTGQTISYLVDNLKGRKPASLRSCAIVRKERRGLEVPLDYLGFVIPDVWVVGYGLDYADRYRTLPYIAELRKEIYTPQDS